MTKRRWNSPVDLTLVFCLGLVGALLPHLFNLGRVEAAAPPVLRGSRFELVDDSGKLRAVLECGAAMQPRLRMLSPEGNAAIDIGLTGAGSSYANFNSADGSPRVAMKMGFGEKPVILMGDRDSPTKLVLGAVQPDAIDPNLDTWALEFNQPPPNYRAVAGVFATLGYKGKPIHGSVLVKDPQGHTLVFGDDCASQ